MEQTAKCEDRIQSHYDSRMDTLRQLWAAYQSGNEEVEDIGSLFDYGLSFDYVAPGTFQEQREGYFRYQLSYGGPSDEFRFFVNPNLSTHRIEYWFLDWFDGAAKELTGPDYDFMDELFSSFFVDSGVAHQQFETAMEIED